MSQVFGRYTSRIRTAAGTLCFPSADETRSADLLEAVDESHVPCPGILSSTVSCDFCPVVGIAHVEACDCHATARSTPAA